MLNEVAYGELLRNLREPTSSLNPLFWRSYQDPIKVNVELERSWPTNRPTKLWAVLVLTPLNLIKMWREENAVFKGFSLVIQAASGEQRTCVSRCPDGTIQEARCSDTAEDMKNCLELTTLQCGSSGSSGEPSLDITQLKSLFATLQSRYEVR